MANRINNVSSSHVSTLIMLLFMLVNANASTKATPIFILGDSTVDVGTNTLLPNCTVKADFPNNGIDFPYSTPTGRFSNGLNLADFLAIHLGHKASPLPFLHLEKSLYGLQHGVRGGANFASAGSGLLDVTGSDLGVLPLSEQMKQFFALHRNLTAWRGEPWVHNFLSNSFFCISTGSNDIFWYFTNNCTTPKYDFVDLMVNEYRTTIQGLYSLGARKFGLVGVSPIGCCPVKRLLNDTLGCFEPMNDFASTFHSQLLSLMHELGLELEDIEYSVGDVYRMSIDGLENPSFYHFNNVEGACCGHGVLNAEDDCNSTANICSDHNGHLFWDLYHASEAAAQIEAHNLLTGPKEYVTPINFATLVQDLTHSKLWLGQSNHNPEFCPTEVSFS